MHQKPVSRSEFAAALNQVAHERNLDPQIVIDSIRHAILAAFKKDHPESYKDDHLYEVELDAGTGEARIFGTQGETYQEEEQTLVRAKKGAARTDITPPGFGRIAAQTAKQVIIQKIREAEKSVIVAEYEKRLQTLVNGMIIRFVGSDIIVDIGKAEAVMPPSEQVHSEDYRLNQRLTFYLQGIRDGLRGKEVVVSRADVGLIRELFRREVPEVASGAVEIKAVARDPGSRTKIAVYSHQSGVDPVGSCVGQKGVRVQAVISELNGEKIDIVQFSEDPDKFVIAALSPATDLKVKIDPKTQTALVQAPPDQLPLAIGRDGQNAKLAGKLAGLHIDIEGVPEKKGTSEKKEAISVQDVPGDPANNKPQT
ncbi:MAG: Transcription termination factor NusA [Candidatus Amesbacteria bacterium GW2011_GWB1_47_19]|nr:MAG: Transcription termination factor NusA [Candidatus Amesbacteria bacterium GW2011_GWA1_44_24]KKU32020.1 MAG: NusA antitermination factor, N utilization substance protein A [Candidatus Amesbacteria bacterium GW2011_GWC1_46_24]KKU67704.1 MAG: Transcription termination factor NusA [Candidatus Amesbacteria bacterium GW2011_GWB1_47_19]HBC72293.1 transcription termination/antitermination protein NusA [Candidatus Amesbacteria bacterium]